MRSANTQAQATRQRRAQRQRQRQRPRRTSEAKWLGDSHSPCSALLLPRVCVQLQRQYRLMELTRKSHSDEKASNVRMQRAAMEKLKKDNDRLKDDLALETRQAKHANNMSASAQIAKLQDQGDLYTRKIELERRRVDELNKQIESMQRHILDSRREMGGVNASRENNSSVAKQIRILENRLDKALVKFNEALAHNKSLREQIDNLRRERVVFDGIYRKLEDELSNKKNAMATILQDSDAAYRARDAAHAEMMALKAAADAQQQNFEQEWSQLGQLIEKDRKLKEFIKTQARERSLKGLSDPAAEEESKLRRKVSKGAKGISEDKAAIHASMGKVQEYEEAFAKIQKATRISDIDELVQTFLSAEDQNFSLFNYVNDLAHEIEHVEESIGELKAEIQKYQAANPTSAADAEELLPGSKEARERNDPQVGALGNRARAQEEAAAQAASALLSGGQGGSGAVARVDADGKPIVDAGPIGPSDSQRKRMMLELEGKLSRTEAQAATYDEKYHSSLRTVSVLKAGIQNLFFKLGCQHLAASEMLGSAGVTESNMMQYLGLIEERTNELVGTLAGAQSDNHTKALAMQQAEEDEDGEVSLGAAQASAAEAAAGGQAADGDEDGQEAYDDDDGEGADEDELAAAAARRAEQDEREAQKQQQQEEDEDGDERPLSEHELRGAAH